MFPSFHICTLSPFLLNKSANSLSCQSFWIYYFYYIDYFLFVFFLSFSQCISLFITFKLDVYIMISIFIVCVYTYTYINFPRISLVTSHSFWYVVFIWSFSSYPGIWVYTFSLTQLWLIREFNYKRIHNNFFLSF